MFTVETVACIGACALAPALMVDEEVYGQMDEEKVQQLIDHLLGEGEKSRCGLKIGNN